MRVTRRAAVHAYMICPVADSQVMWNSAIIWGSALLRRAGAIWLAVFRLGIGEGVLEYAPRSVRNRTYEACSSNSLSCHMDVAQR